MKYRYASEKWETPWFSEVLPDGEWKGHEAVVVGGGPSFSSFNLSYFADHPWSIGVNLAFMRFAPRVIVGADLECLDWILSGAYEDRLPGCRERFLELVAREPFPLVAWFTKYPVRLPPGIFALPMYRMDLEASLAGFVTTSAEGLPHGDNAGFLGLQLAVVLGANPIYLIGFDMRHVPDRDGPRTHWHPAHPSGVSLSEDALHLERFLDRFRAAAPKLSAAGIRVVNLTPDSALDCFERARPEEVL